MKMKILNTIGNTGDGTQPAGDCNALGVIRPRAFRLNRASPSAPKPPVATHLVMPRDEIILAELTEVGQNLRPRPQRKRSKPPSLSIKQLLPRNPIPGLIRRWKKKAMAREGQLSSAPMAAQAVQPVNVTIFTLAVDFDNYPPVKPFISMMSFHDPDGCDDGAPPVSDTFSGPLVGTIPYPDPVDNNTLWYDPSLYTEDAGDPSWYNDLIFGYDGVGRVRADEAARGETGD